MAVGRLSISYDDFQMGETIEPDQFDVNNSEFVTKINEIVDRVNAISVDGTGDTTEIPANIVTLNAVSPFTATDVDTLFDQLIARLQSIVTETGSSLIGTKGLAGLTALNVQGQLEELNTIVSSLDGTLDDTSLALNTHKSSTDHDHRYYTEGETDTFLADKTDLSGNHVGLWQGYTPAEVASGEASLTVEQARNDSTVGLTLEARIDDPVDPEIGRIWLRTDL